MPDISPRPQARAHAASTTPKRIIVNANQCYTLVRFRGDLIRALVEQGHEVIVTLPEPPAELAAPLAALGAKSLIVPMSRSSMNPWHDFAYTRALRLLYSEFAPDIVFSIMVKPAVFGSLSARLAGVPRVVAMFTGLGYAFDRPRSLKQSVASVAAHRLSQIALRHVDRVIFHNTDDRDLFVARRLAPAERCSVVDGSGVDLEHFAQTPLPDVPSFLLIARLLQAKGIREYVEAARIVKSEFPDVRCVLAGPFDHSPDAVNPAIINRAQREGVIDFLGLLADVRPAMHDAQVVVLPSYREGRPRVVLEAMATGRPIITTDVPGCRETVLHGVNGLLVKPHDAGSLADAMIAFCRDRKLAAEMARASADIAKSRYDVRMINSAMIRHVLGE